MNRIHSLLFIFIMAAAVLVPGCKKQEPAVQKILKYAKYQAAVYRESELKSYAATLAKTEPVTYIESITIKLQGKDVEVARIILSDNTTVYTQARNLADQPLVFVEDTKVYVRNNISSKIYTVVPKGTIGFIMQENGEWTRVYAGKIKEKWISGQWVNGGFTTESVKVQEAKNYEEAVKILENGASKPEQKKQAIAILNELTSSATFSDLAGNALSMYANRELQDTKGDEASGEKDGSLATVTAETGLRMREKPDTESTPIVLIPRGEKVRIISEGNAGITIAGKTSVWYEVQWNGKQGWVFGGFLDMKE